MIALLVVLVFVANTWSFTEAHCLGWMPVQAPCSQSACLLLASQKINWRTRCPK